MTQARAAPGGLRAVQKFSKGGDPPSSGATAARNIGPELSNTLHSRCATQYLHAQTHLAWIFTGLSIFFGSPGTPGIRPGIGRLLRGNTGAAASGRAASRKGGREFSKVWKIPPGRNWLWKTSDLTPPSDVGAQLISLSTTASGGSWHMGVRFWRRLIRALCMSIG
jgi:hypothetical protein